MRKNIINLFFIMFTLLFASKSYAQCTSCDDTVNSGGNTLTLAENQIYCINGDVSFSDISWANNTTICIPSGSKLTINNNMQNNENTNTVNFEIYGELQFGNPQFAVNVNMNIHSGGSFEAGNTAFKENNVKINNQGNFHVSLLEFNGNSGTINILNSESATFKVKNNLNVETNIALIYNNEGRLEIGGHFELSAISKFSNCDKIDTEGFNLRGGTIYNTGIFISKDIDGQGEIHNYGTIELQAITGNKKTIYNYGTIDVSSNSIVDMEIHGPTEPPYYGKFTWKGKAQGVNDTPVFGNQLFKNTDGDSSKSEMLGNTSGLKPQDGSSIIWGDCSECEVVNEGVECIDAETGEAQKKKENYWHGTVSNEWNNPVNWTATDVPKKGEDIEFATDVNNGSSGNGNGLGTAIRDLHLDTDRVIGDLINNSNVDLLVTTGNQLTINGVVKDDNPNKGTIVVKTSTNKPTGTLLFSNPSDNQHVNATVEFYNKAYECATCGFYRKQWQYFGIPVQSSDFPYLSPQVETVNQWVEPYIYSNKWRPAPYTPDLTLKAFKGYEMTNSNDTEPTHIYSFPGILNVGDATVGVTKTANVDYSGMNLLSNSFTAAIPITSLAINLGSVVLKENTAYLFNMGTRDQWRKLNGGSAYGVAAGQYQAVPFNIAGQAGIPDRILSMHTFMLDVITPGNITLKYDQLLKNELNASTVKPWKSAKLRSSTIQLPYIVMDVIGEESADRVWIFGKEGTTHGFDNGWDGRKMAESGIAQLYVTGTDESQLQVATVPTMENVLLGFEADADGKYTLEFSLSEQLNTVEIHLQDLVTGTSQRLSDGGSYQFEAKKGDTAARFRLSQSGEFTVTGDEALIDIEPVGDGKVMIRNRSGNACTAFLSNDKGAVLQRVEVSAGGEEVLENMSAGVYVVRLQNATVNDARKVTVD